MCGFFMSIYCRFVLALTCLVPSFICTFNFPFKNKNKKYLYSSRNGKVLMLLSALNCAPNDNFVPPLVTADDGVKINDRRIL